MGMSWNVILPKALEYLKLPVMPIRVSSRQKLEPWIDNMRKHINQEK